MPSKLVLFDIDETLIDSDGAGRRSLGKALSHLFGVKPEAITISMSGKTDPQILAEILQSLGYKQADYVRRLDELFDFYVQTLEAELQQAKKYKVHEGVFALLDELNSHGSASLGLLTGNIERGARLKLARCGLNKYFPIGAYGSDSANRLDLPKVARERAEAHYQDKFEPSQIVIVGDSIHDILCAQGYGAVSIAVNTGRTSRQELEALSPDFLFPSLCEVEQVLQAIMN